MLLYLLKSTQSWTHLFEQRICL